MAQSNELWGIWYSGTIEGWYGDGSETGAKAFKSKAAAEQFHGKIEKSSSYTYEVRPITQTVEKLVEKSVPPSLDSLAFALFCTDERVQKDVAKHFETGVSVPQFLLTTKFAVGSMATNEAQGCTGAVLVEVKQAELRAMFEKAFSSDRLGLATEARNRAYAMLEVLKTKEGK